MVSFIQQLIKLLLSPPGNLVYHLVLAFSVVGVLPAAVSQWKHIDLPRGKRMVIGLICLLIARLLWFTAAAIARQGLIDEHLLLPPADRGVILFSLVWIIWLWCFPKQQRLADILAVFFGLLAVLAFGLILAWWFYRGAADISFNSFPASRICDALALALLVIGGLIVVIRRPKGWRFGLVTFGILAIGHAISLVFPSSEFDYSGAVRLTQMVAYPLLFALPQRFMSEFDRFVVPAIPHSIEEHRHYGIDLHLLQSFLALGVETEAAKLYRAITLSVGHTMVADLCFLVSSPKQPNGIIFDFGYDLIREEHLPGFTIKAHKIPELTAAMQQNHTLTMAPDSHSPDLKNLAHILNLSETGHLLATPIGHKQGEAGCMIMLLTPYSKREWTNEDQSTLVSIANSLAQILQRNLAQAPFLDEINALRQNLKAAQSDAEAARQEIARLSPQNKSLEMTGGEETNVGTGDESESQSIITSLRAEIDQLREQIKSQEAARQGSSMMQDILEMQSTEQNNQQLTGELHLALEEIARLNKTLSEMEQADSEVLSQTSHRLASGSKSEIYTDIAKELDSPLASISGYSDFLLAESFGNLGPIQRKFVERIKFSCDRINHILEITPEIASTLEERLQLNPEAIDLQALLDRLIARVHMQLLEKRISFDNVSSLDLPPVKADREALEQILTSLLDNAIAVTVEEGKITFNAKMQATDAEQNMMLIQISDQGGGLPTNTNTQVFVSQPKLSDIILANQGIDAAMLKDLVLMQNGDIWIERQEGTGSTINILMPVFEIQPPEKQEGAAAE